jgi:hypothetical protein
VLLPRLRCEHAAQSRQVPLDSFVWLHLLASFGMHNCFLQKNLSWSPEQRAACSASALTPVHTAHWVMSEGLHSSTALSVQRYSWAHDVSQNLL